MADSFDFAEFGMSPDGDEPQEPGTAEAIAETIVNESMAQRPEASDYMADVDKRLDVAATYRELLRAPLFDVETESTVIVEDDIRAFIIERLQVLLSMKAAATPATAPQFDDREVKALKILLATMEKKGMMPAADKAPAAVPSPAPPRVAPAAPAVRRAAAPAPAPAQRRPAPAPARQKPAPPAEAPRMVVDPRTGEAKALKPNKKAVRGSGGVPMPSQAGLHQAAASQAHIRTQGGTAGLAPVMPALIQLAKDTPANE